MQPLRISAKNLGALALPDFCPRCFWLKMKCRKGLPFQIFPGIFSSIDSYSKKITNVCYERFSSLPAWFDGFNGLLKPVRVPHHTDFFIIDPATGIRLTGVPDEIFHREDDSFFVADYKTARHTDNQDSLAPLYKVQLNAYAYIGERCGFKPVSGLGLVYYEPQTMLASSVADTVIRNDRFLMGFKAKLIEVELKPQTIIPPLMAEARRICDCTHPPKSRDGCKDCERLDEMLRLLRNRA